MTMQTTIEVEPIAVTQLTGRMGTLVVERDGHTWRGELIATGRMGSVTFDGGAVDRVPVWLQRKLARATVMMQSAYAA